MKSKSFDLINLKDIAESVFIIDFKSVSTEDVPVIHIIPPV
jgi:hypothetical protein